MAQITETDIQTYIGTLLIEMLAMRKDIEGLTTELAKLRAEAANAAKVPNPAGLKLVE